MRITGMTRPTLYRHFREHVRTGRAMQVSRGRWRARTTDEPSPWVIVLSVVPSHPLARASARYARTQPMRRTTETSTERAGRPTSARTVSEGR